jgi:hypothetical protein
MTSTANGTRTRSRKWCGRMVHQAFHYKNPMAASTPCRVAIPTYWAWTKDVDLDDYDLAEPR